MRRIVIGVCIIWLLASTMVYASENMIDENAFEEYEFQEMDQLIKELFPETHLDFKEIILQIISGETEVTFELIVELIKERITYAFTGCKNNLIHLIVLAIFAAVFTNFSNVFQNKQISEMCFFVLYLLMIGLCLNSFQLVTEWVNEGIQGILNFMKAFCPIFFIAVSTAKGSITATAFYNLGLLLIYLVELVIVNLILPAIHVYFMVRILNHLSEEEYLSKMAEFIEVIISWILKAVVAGIIGLNFVQGMINPAIDTIKRSTLIRGAEAIPGVGDALGGTAEVIIAAAVLIKNGIGIAGAVICFMFCVVPIVQIALIILVYKLAAAVIQPISDKRVIGCMDSVSEGGKMMMKVIITTGILFLLTVVMVTTATNQI